MRFKFGAVASCLLLLSSMTSFQATSAMGIVEDSLEIFKLIEVVTENVLKAWDLIDELPLNENDLPIMKSKQRQIMERLDQLNDQISHTEKLQEEFFKESIDTLAERQLADSVKSHKIFIVNDIFKIIGTRYNLLSPFQRDNETSEPYTLISNAEWCVKPSSSSLIYLLEQLHDEFFGVPEIAINDNSNKPLFTQLVASFESDANQICSSGRAPQQFAYELYTKAAMAEVKAYVMMEFSWMTLRHFGKGNFTQERKQMRDSYQRRMLHSQQLLREVMRHTGRVYWRCDPKPGEHVLGKTYDVITRLLLGFVDNEINLNPDGTCYQTCEDYTNARTESCLAGELCNKQPKCTGRVHSCRFVDTDLHVCQSNNANSTRRYHYVKGGNGHLLGTDNKFNKSCNAAQDVGESWSSKLFWRCNYCFCLCDEDDLPSDRYFNLRDTLSDFNLNMIVTGARFVKNQRVIHLQLQQGQLLPGGKINQSSLAWIPLESFDVSHVDIRNNYDYHKLTYESRALDLDEITAHNDSLVVTGARFRVVNKHLNLEVRFSLFNFTTGQLLLPEVKSIWLTNNNKQDRQKLALKDPQVSDQTKLYSIPLSSDNQFMDFVSSSVDLDAAQSTVPYIDIQDVVPNPAVPLSGLGLYHKGRSGFGGFIAPKIVTLDLSQTIVPPKTPK